jgi:hypothetical protein
MMHEGDVMFIVNQKFFKGVHVLAALHILYNSNYSVFYLGANLGQSLFGSDSNFRLFLCALEVNSSVQPYFRDNSPWPLVRKRTIDRRMSGKLVLTFADRGCRVVSATDPPGS